ncbi:MAG: DUF721 domain-containing protein [Bacteroidales bacterium]|jgi:hypothetical protein|nr:DUF721 domain-containing protein [Bacteroidales bacterium]
MRRSETLPINELLKLCIKQNSKLEDGIDNVRIKAIWKNVAGEHIFKATKEIYVSDKSLVIAVSSSIIRGEILLIRSELVKRINYEIGRNFVSEIILR